MKSLLYAAILGFTLWIISEVIELRGGYTSAAYYLTAAFHILGGFGIWGVHLLQSRKTNTLSLVGTLIISLTYFSIVYFPIQVMNSGLSVAEFIQQNQVYKIPGFTFLVGHIIFGIAVIKTKYFASWTGFALIVTAAIVTGIYTYEVFTGSVPVTLHTIVNIDNIALAATVIYMCVFGLKHT